MQYPENVHFDCRKVTVIAEMKAFANIKHSFPSRVSLIVVIVTSVIFAIAIGATAVTSNLLLKAEATKGVVSVTAAARNEIEKSLRRVEATVDCSARMVPDMLDDEEYLFQLTYRIVDGDTNIIGSAVALARSKTDLPYGFSPYSYDNGSGLTVSKDLAAPDYDYFDMEWFSRPMESGKSCWSEPYFDESGGEALMSTYSVPVKDRDGNVIAVVTADVSLEWLGSIMSRIHPYEGSFATLTSRDGKTISGSGKKLERPDAVMHTVLDSLGINAYWFSDSRRTFCVDAALENGWKAQVVSSYDEILKRSARLQANIGIIGILGLLLLFVLCYLTIRKLTGALVHFSDAVSKIGEGNFDTPIPEVDSEDEIRMLRDSFDNMQKSLGTYVSELRQTTAANEKMQNELDIASNIQMAMLTRNFPKDDSFELYAFLKPAKQVGGDLYDFTINNGKLYFLIGDVSGKGVPAALVMAITRASFRFLAGLGLSAQEIVTKLNDSIAENNSTHMFVTIFTGVIELGSGEAEYCNAGHNPTLVIPPDEKPFLLRTAPNLAVGLIKGFAYKSVKVHIRKGTSVVLYTDGVTEAENDHVGRQEEPALFSEERLLAWAEGIGTGRPAREMTESLHDAVLEFADGTEQNDDITIMTLKF